MLRKLPKLTVWRAIFAAIMLLMAWGIFIWSLNMPIKVFPWS